MKDFGTDESYFSGFSMEDDLSDDIDEVEEEVITNNYYEDEPEEEPEEEYYDDEPYEDEYYDEGSVQPYDDRMEKILAELAELKKNIGNIQTGAPAAPATPQQPQVVQPQQIFTPIPFPMSQNNNNNEMILNELSRLRDEHSRQQAVLEMNAQISRLKDEFNKELQQIAKSRKEEPSQKHHDREGERYYPRERERDRDREREREREHDRDRETGKAILNEIAKLKESILKIETENAEGAEATRVLHPAVKGGKVSQLTVKANAIGNNLSKLNARVSDIGNIAGGAPNKAITDELQSIKKDIAYLAGLTGDIASASFSKLVTATADDGSTQIINIANDELMSRIKDIYTLIGNLGTKSAELSGQVTDVKRALGINVLCFKEDDGSFNYRPLEDKLSELKFLASSATAPANVKARAMLDFATLLKDLPVGHRDDICNVFEAVANLIKASTVNRADGKLLCAETGNSGKSFALDKIFELKDSLAAADVSNYADLVRSIADYKNKVQNNVAVDSNQVLSEEIAATYDELVIADEANFDQISANLNELVEILTGVTIGDIVKIPDYKSFRPDKPSADFGMISQLDNIKDLIAQSNEQIFALDKFPMVFDRLGEVEARMQDFFNDPNKHYDILQEIAVLKEEVLGLINPVFETTVLADLQAIKEISENQLSSEEQIQLASDAAVIHDVLSQVITLKEQIDTQISLMQDEKIVQDLEELHQRLDIIDDMDADVQEIRQKLEVLDKIDADITTLNMQLDTVKDELLGAIAIPNPEIMAEIANVRDEIFAYVDDLVPKLNDQLTGIKDDIMAMNTYLGADFAEKLDTLSEKLSLFNDSLSSEFADQISMLQAELASLNGSVGPELSELILNIREEVAKLNGLMNDDMNENFRIIKNDLEILKDNSTEIETLNELLQLREELNNYINREPDQSIPDEVYALREEILALSNMVSQNPILQEFEVLKEKIESDTAVTLDNIAQDIQTLKEQTSDSSQVVLEEIISNMSDIKERLDKSASNDVVESIALDIFELKERSEQTASQSAIDSIFDEINSLKEKISSLALNDSINLLNDDITELRSRLEDMPVLETLEKVMDEIDLIKENLEAASGKTVMEVKESLNVLQEEAAKKENLENVIVSLETVKEDIEHIMMTAAANAVQLEGIQPLGDKTDKILENDAELKSSLENIMTELTVLVEDIKTTVYDHMETLQTEASANHEDLKLALENIASNDETISGGLENISGALEELAVKDDELASALQTVSDKSDSLSASVEGLEGILGDLRSVVDVIEQRDIGADVATQLEALQANLIDHTDSVADSLYTADTLEEIKTQISELSNALDEFSNRKTDPALLNELYRIQDILENFDASAKHDEETRHEANVLSARSTNLIFDELSNLREQLSAKQYGVDPELAEKIEELKLKIENDALESIGGLKAELNDIKKQIEDNSEAYTIVNEERIKADSEKEADSAEKYDRLFDEISRLADISEERAVLSAEAENADAERIERLMDSIEELKDANASALEAFAGERLEQLTLDIEDIKAANAELLDSIQEFTALKEELNTVSSGLNESISEKLDAISRQIAESRFKKVKAEESDEEAPETPMSLSEEMADNILAIREQIEYNSNQYVLNNIADDIAELKEKLSIAKSAEETNEEGAEGAEGTEGEEAKSVDTEGINVLIDALREKLTAEIDDRFAKLDIALNTLKDDLKGANLFDAEVNAEDLENDPVMVELRSIKDEIIVQRDNQLAAQVLSAENTQELLNTIKAMQEEAYLNKGELDPEILQAVRDLKTALSEQSSTAKHSELRAAIEKLNENVAGKEMFDRLSEQLDILHDEIVAVKLDQSALSEAAITSEQTDTDRSSFMRDAAFEKLSQQIESVKEAMETKVGGVTLDDVLTEVNILRQQIASLKDDGIETETRTESSTVYESESSEKLDAIAEELKVISDYIQTKDDEINALLSRDAESQESVEDENGKASGMLETVLERLESLGDDLSRLQEMQFESHSALSSFDNVSILDELGSIKEQLAGISTANKEIEESDEIKKAFEEVKSAISLMKEDAEKNRELYNSVKEIRLNAATQALSDENSKVLFELFNEFKEELQNKGVKTLIEQDLNDSILEIKQDIVTNKADTDNHIIIEFNTIKDILGNLQTALGAGNERGLTELSEKINALGELLSGGEIDRINEQVVLLKEKGTDLIQSELETLKHTLSDLSIKQDDMQAFADRADENTDIVLAEILNLKDQIESKSEREVIDALKAEILELKEQLTRPQNDITELKQEILELKEQLKAKESSAGNADIQALLSEIKEIKETAKANELSKEVVGDLFSEIKIIKERTSAQLASTDFNVIAELVQEIKGLPALSQNPAETVRILSDEISDVRTQVNLALVDNANMSEGIKVVSEQMGRLISAIANHQPDTAQIREVLRQELMLLNIGQPQFNESAIINEIANLKAELNKTSSEPVKLDNSLILDELAKLKEELSQEKPSDFNRQLLEEIARIKDDIVAIGNKEIAPATLDTQNTEKDFTQSLNELKKELNEIASIVEVNKLDDTRKEGRYGINRRGGVDETDSDMPDPAESLKANLKAQKAQSMQIGGVKKKSKTGQKSESSETKKSVKPKSATTSTQKTATKAETKKTETKKAVPVKTEANKTEPLKTETKASTAPKATQRKTETTKPKTQKATASKPEQAITALPFDDDSTELNELNAADMLAKQVAHKLIMEQLVQQLGDGAVPQERVDELVTSILPDDKVGMDEQSDSIKRIANQLVLEKLRNSLNRKK